VLVGVSTADTVRERAIGYRLMQPLVADRIERELLIHAPIEVVWSVITQPDHISGWFSDTVELDLSPGGAASFHWDADGIRRGRVERVEPPHFFSFRWVVEPGPEVAEDNSTLVEFSLEAEGDGTRLRVVESGFRDLAGPEDERRRHLDSHRRGWELELAELEEYLRQHG
jgi:uncharacterized protein YndB with AHSA1/START domain